MPQKRHRYLASLGRIGVLTTSGKAYHALVSELSRKGLEYVSLLPRQSVPLDVRVIVTTDRSENTIQGRSVLAFEEGSDPREAVEESILLLLGKVRFRSLVLGIDPGKQTGLAVLGDGLILETGSYTEAKDLVEDVAHILSAFPSERSVVKIGRGAEEYSRALRSILGSRLSPVVEIQMVEEAGTTTDSLSPEDEGMSRNIVSAIRIALRQGEKMGRRGRCPSP